MMEHIKKIIIAICFILLATPCFAVNYYADNQASAAPCTGNYSIANRTCTGSDGNSYATIQAAVNAASAGDTVYVRTGTYPEELNTTVNGGNESGRITIRNYGSESVTVTQVDIDHNYNTIQGFTILGHGSYWTVGGVRIGVNADYCKVLNNTIGAQVDGTFGIHFRYSGSPPAPDAATYCTISGNTISSALIDTAIEIWGSNNTVSNNTVSNLTDADFLRIWGHDHTISDNTFDTITDGPSGNHIDCFQTFGDNRYESYNVVMERNVFKNVTGQICQVTMDGVWTIKDWTIRNNIFSNISNGASVSMSGMKWQNNTFYKVNQVSGHALAMVRGEKAISAITRANPGVVTVTSALGWTGTRQFKFVDVGGMTELNGNTYTITSINSTSFSIGVDTSGYGEYTSGGYAVYAGAYDAEITNNAFLECGSSPSNTGFGWYSWETGLTGYSSDYNYVAGTSNASKGSSFTETHGVNGGNAKFTNAASGDFSISAADSVLVDSGTSLSTLFTTDKVSNTRSGTWDIGAYEYDASPDTTPPTISSAAVGTTGTTLTIVFNEAVTVSAAEQASTSFTLTMSGGAATIVYASGSGTNTLKYNITGRTIDDEETGTAALDFTTSTNGIEDQAGNDLAATGDSDKNVTNDSTYSPSETTYTVSVQVSGICTVSPIANQVIVTGETAQFTCVPNGNWGCGAWSGTAETGCASGLGTSTYTTGAITGDCTVNVTCTKIAADAKIGAGNPGQRVGAGNPAHKRY